MLRKLFFGGAAIADFFYLQSEWEHYKLLQDNSGHVFWAIVWLIMFALLALVPAESRNEQS